MKAAAILLAAGKGSRLGKGGPKAFVRIAGRRLFEHSLDTFLSEHWVQEIVLVVPRGMESRTLRSLLRRKGWTRNGKDGVAPGGKRIRVVAGGRRRQDSVGRGLAAVSGEPRVIAVHDTARPLVSPKTVRAVLRRADRSGACICAAPASDTIKRIRGDRIVETPDRERLRHAQTPQAFRAAVIRKAFALAKRRRWSATDCSALIERTGVPVRVVAPRGPNPKATTREDLAVLEALLRRRRK